MTVSRCRETKQARWIGMSDIPTVRLSQMTEVDRRAYVIADNKLALNASWDSLAKCRL
jgi:hypothetical protein